MNKCFLKYKIIQTYLIFEKYLFFYNKESESSPEYKYSSNEQTIPVKIDIQQN